MDVWLISFPRSGSNFFITEFAAMSGIILKLTHGMLKRDVAISCIRNPKDTLSSLLAMKLTQINYGDSGVPDERITFQVSSVLKQMTVSYKNFYNYLLSSKNIIIDYESFCKNPSKYVQKVCNKLNIDTLNDKTFTYNLKDNPQRGYLVSSLASSEYYEVAVKAVRGLDLSELELLYEMTLDKSLSL